MYHAHFALREEPFGASPDHRFFLPTEQHRKALATLYYAVQERRGFGLLIGKAGLGKTSVLVKLLQALKDQSQTVYFPHPYFDRKTVLESILLALRVEPSQSIAENFRRLQDYLITTEKAGQTCVVVFDEAHALPVDTLETIRMLSNTENASGKLIQIILAGQASLAETLNQPELEQLRQRCSVVARLEPLSRGEVSAYMSYRLEIAGASSSLFSPEAVAAVASASGGVPRNVNTLSANAMTLAFARDHDQVSKDEVEEAIRNLDLDRDLRIRQTNVRELAAREASVRDTALVRYTTEKILPAGSSRLSFVTRFLSVRSSLLAVVVASIFLLLSWVTGMVITDYR